MRDGGQPRGVSEDAGEGSERLRRRFAAAFSPLAVVLVVLGLAFTGNDGISGAPGLATLAQGIGLVVALVWLGHNPLPNLTDLGRISFPWARVPPRSYRSSWPASQARESRPAEGRGHGFGSSRG